MTHSLIRSFTTRHYLDAPKTYWVDGTGATLREVETPAGTYFVPDYVVLDRVAAHHKLITLTHIRNPFTVNFWGSHPDEGNDDCFSGSDFSSAEEALAEFAEPCFDRSVMYVEVDGPGVHELRRNFHYSASARTREDAAERSERAMQAGMGLGVAGYNDEMGYG